MTEEERRLQFIEARDRNRRAVRERNQPPAYQPPPPLLPAPVELPRFDQDDALVRWKQGMIEAGVVEVQPKPKINWPLTDYERAQIERENRAAEALAAIDSRVETALQAREWQHQATLDAVGNVIGQVKRELRGEIRQRAQHPRSVIDILPYDRSRSRV